MKRFTQWFIAVFFLIVMSVNIQASSIITYIELVLADSGVLLHGEYDISLSIADSNDEVLWTEVHEDIIVLDGVVSFPFGTIETLKTTYFYDQGTQLTLTINDESINLPMYSIPFSFFSHAADTVNSIQMNGVFHSDLVNERVGIGIDEPTPSARLEIGGAFRVASVNTTEAGTLRFNPDLFRLEGMHNDGWKLLDISEADKLDSKWSVNDAIESFYVFNQAVYIGTYCSNEMLCVGGSTHGSGWLLTNEQVTINGYVTVASDYQVTPSGNILVDSIYLDELNYFDFTDGLIISGSFHGDGAGIMNVDQDSLAPNSIDNHEISSLVFTAPYFQDDSVSNEKLTPLIVDQTLLSSDFLLDASFLMPLIVSDNLIQRETVVMADVAEDFELTSYQFLDEAVVSVNIAFQAIDNEKINQDELAAVDFDPNLIDDFLLIGLQEIKTNHIKDGDIQLNDIKASTLSYDHLVSDLDFLLGGTYQDSYGQIGELLVVSGNQFVSAPSVLINATGIGLNNASPEYPLDITAFDDVNYALKIKSLTDKQSNLILKNDLGVWSMLVDDAGAFTIENQIISTFDLLKIDGNGLLGVLSDPGIEKVTVGGAIHIGDTSIDSNLLLPGTIYFGDNDFQFVTDSGIQSLAFQDLSQPIPSYLYVKNVENFSENSRVTLGEDSVVVGTNHLIQGGFASYVDGNQQLASFINGSKMVGSDSILSFANHSGLFGQFNRSDQVSFSTIIGHHNSIHQLDRSTVIGDRHSVKLVRNSDIHGSEINLAFVDDSVALGVGHRVRQAEALSINGNNHTIEMASDSEVFGNLNTIRFADQTMIDGRGNFVEQTNEFALTGLNNYVSLSRKGTVVGSDNFIMMGDGNYSGSNNRHLGGGKPLIIGDNNTVIGAQNTIIDGNDQVVMGSFSDNEHISNDGAIILSAYGGVDIIHHDRVVAHLPQGAGSWSHVSDKNLKINVTTIDSPKILGVVSELPISEWGYKGQDYVRHIGPMAQDFYALFGLGNSDRLINSVDVDGVILASIQGLGSQLKSLIDSSNLYDNQHTENWNELSSIRVDLRSFDVSSNSLIQTESEITDRYQRIHDKEISQRQTIEQLNDRIDYAKELLEKMQ